MYGNRFTVLLTLGLSLLPSVVFGTEASKVDLEPFMSWNGGTIAFTRDLGFVLVSYGTTRRLVSLTRKPDRIPGEPPILVLGKPLWEDEMREPAISPDSTKVAWSHSYLVYVDANSDPTRSYDFSNVYYTDLRTGRIAKVTTRGGRHPVWSPDGQWIAYVTPKRALQATNIHTGRSRVLASEMTSEERMAWLTSGPAVALERIGKVAWYHISQSGALHRISRGLRLPRKPVGGQQVFRAWALSRDGKKLICCDADTMVGVNSFKQCTIRLVTSRSVRTIRRFDARWISTAGEGPDQYDVEIAFSGSGRKYVLELYGGVWKGSVNSGKLKQITNTLSW